MINKFVMNPKVEKQLNIIQQLQTQSENTVQSLYAQAIIEYSLYHFKKDKLQHLLDEALRERDKMKFYQLSLEYTQWLDAHKEGKMVREDGFELLLTFE
ncbi:hypothetical protein JCM9140_2387 [Halalkalibacter wakoensis JCM 9140]|uniref:IDEAL domain-containing protein n=1 Tax=Halalkalibacter wakoensis JCM 9140 TaxID=1236970 RepID=W4Q2M7_9BACI|nr:IDEAL domain-containing protein [Halalkalibacter wakoensis]GAE26336.1 hypothetical protein JCM9140_2387 [Halalkalibacter wakoensis JCM 9140]